MKRILRNSLVVLFALFLIISCSKEEVGMDSESHKEIGKLSFGSVLGDLANRYQLTKGNLESYGIPECSEDSPLFVRVAIQKKDDSGEWIWYKNSNENKIEIKVNPNGTDLDGDGNLDAWFTQESADLELEEGEYRIEYFSVATAAGNNEADIIYMAPRIPAEDMGYSESIQYHKFVNKPLPIEVKIRPGVKYYQPVEVLCYEEHYAFAFGYLFFDFNSTNLIYLCTYGNICDEDQKHKPAQFKMKVWEDSNEKDLLVVAQNERKSFQDENGNHYYADALCFPLPEIEEYYAKIWLVEGETEILIREGSFNATNLSEIYRQEQEHYYYHFREACCDEADNFELLDDLTENEEECDEEPQDPEEPQCKDCEGTISKLTFKYLGNSDTSIIVDQKTSGDNTKEIFNDIVSSGATFTVTGEFSQGNQPNSLWTDIFIQEGDKEEIQIHTSCSDPDVLPGYTVGNFKIISGESTGGGLLCPKPD